MMDLVSKMQPIINNVKEYIGAYQTPGSDYEEILSAAVEKYSARLYADPRNLGNAMREFGATQAQVTKVYMMTLVAGFRELLEQDERIPQADIDRYVQNAVQETGFTVTLVLELTYAIVASLGGDFTLSSEELQKWKNKSSGFVIPLCVYEQELKNVKQAFERGSLESIRNDEITRLEELARLGLPRAKYYLGRCLLEDTRFEKNVPLGLQYLKEAAADGDYLAAGALGDYYYEQANSESWSQAYAYYTKNGSIALNDTQKERTIDILNSRRFNLATIAASMVIACVMLAMTLIAPASALFAPRRVWGCIFFVLDVAIITLAVMHHRQKPYDNLSFVPCVLFVIWTLYFLVRIVF